MNYDNILAKWLVNMILSFYETDFWVLFLLILRVFYIYFWMTSFKYMSIFSLLVLMNIHKGYSYNSSSLSNKLNSKSKIWKIHCG